MSKEPKFEEKMEELEKIINELENGEIDTNYKANNHLTLVDFTNKKRLSKEQAEELTGCAVLACIDSQEV